jgi:pimeloyl-ACP methyl ester carboxylesterase
MNSDRLNRLDFMRDGLVLAAYDSGGDGLPVIFQHGLCGDARQTAEVFPDDPGLRLITLECRGHGASQAGSSFSIASLAGDVTALIDELGLKNFALGGISMGAAIASRIAVQRPKSVRALILARPAWVSESGPDNLAPNREVGGLLERLPKVQARAAFLASPTHDFLAREAPDNLASLMSFFDREPIGVTSALLTAICTDGPGVAETDLAALSMPVLILSSAKDFIHPVAFADRLARLIPHAAHKPLTPKGVDKAAYVADFQAALGAFLKDF